ncbi:hypothetical protein HY489_04135 [Candidatus Woesearchaeota archaeon]|nr:hypothetical protein [Candidatus Woesearchaeota archaeon]
MRIANLINFGRNFVRFAILAERTIFSPLMRSDRSSLILITLVLVFVLAMPVLAQERGCCCDPVVKNGSIQTREDCDRQKFIFAGFPGFKTCSDHCNATLGKIAVGFCGDGICQANENALSCSADCAPLQAGCGSPTFRPAPRDLTVVPVRGEKAFALSFSIPCPVDFLSISRCKGLGCGDFSKIADIAPATSFNDEDESLLFATDYTYSVVAHYRQVGDSEPGVASGNLGDLECWKQLESSFCISPFFYERFRSYLLSNGYAQYDAADFASQFDRFVELAFGGRFNRAWRCNGNVLVGPQVSCEGDQVCRADERGANCMSREDCGGGDPFGLYSAVSGCEGVLPRYCFFDKSATVQDKCYDCDPRMSCYDYKSSGACQRDNCGVGECEWRSTFSDVGAGVCIDKKKSNCAFCDKRGTDGVGNIDAFSALWDSCREEKSSALSTNLFPCFFDKELRISKSCDEASCSDYTRLQCGSPGAITLNPDNSLATFSTDPCGIRVCQFDAVSGCAKKADGRSSFRDCKFGNKSCERDYFAPVTTLIPFGVGGRIDGLNVRIFDKVSKLVAPRDFAGQTGYKTFLCVKSASNDCRDAAAFPILTTATQLLLKNRFLKDVKDGKARTLAQLEVGNNTIAFYSRDPASNLEVVKESVVVACDACQGPTLVNASVSGGRFLGGEFFTSATIPTFTLEFDEPTLITYAELRSELGNVPLAQVSQGVVTSHQFVASQALRGNYSFGVNGKNVQGVFVNNTGLSYLVVVDPSLADVRISPPDGSILNKTSIDIVLEFSRPVTLSRIQIVLESFSDPFVKRQISRDITDLFKVDNNNRTFTASVTNLTGGGMHTIVVDALGFNGLPIFKQSSVFIATLKPNLRLSQPAFGVTPYVSFDAVVESPLPSVCAYVFNTPTAPSSQDFDFFKKFSGEMYLHSASGLQIGDPAQEVFLLHAYCRLNLFGLVNRTFPISFDPEPPFIVKSWAEPGVISERFFPDQELFVAALKVQLDKPGFCKFSRSVSTFEAMEGVFPGFDLAPKVTLSAEVNVSSQSSFTYYVACKGKNQLVSEPVQIKFGVDLSRPLSVSSSTPFGSRTTNFTVGVFANKRVFCYVGERENDATKCMGACRSAYSQAQEQEVSGEGNYTYFVQCAHASGEKSDVLRIPVLVDTSVPEMEYVTDDSALEDVEVSWSLRKLRVAFKGNDAESGIDHYLVSLRNLQSKRLVFKDMVVNVTHGQPFYVSTNENGTPLRLANGDHYQFIVKAVNRVGQESAALESDGVAIDSSQQPDDCANGDLDGEESDVDCGGACNPCESGLRCALDRDCVTNYCNARVCELAKCTDGAMNGLESDVDCGGKFCPKCGEEKSCIVESDCDTDYCDPVRKLCAVAPPCADKAASPGETDVDCGGPCTPCVEGKGCLEHTDCASGLSCDPETKACSTKKVGDDDADGVLDDKDKCPGTPVEESADESGCGLSQLFSVGDDINDKWRMDFFGCIDCPEAAADGDFDGDGLVNLREFELSSNPKLRDSDGDGWRDGLEVEKGTNVLDPSSHPPSAFKALLWLLLGVLVFGSVAYGGFLLSKMRREVERVEERVERREEARRVETLRVDELEHLRSFAHKVELPEKDWVSLEREIKKKPLPKKRFREELERLRRIARRETVGTPLERLRSVLGDLSERERRELERKLEMFKRGELPREEADVLFKKLQVTAEYYKTHREEFERELRRYGKR